MAISRSDLKVGMKVSIPAFEGTIVSLRVEDFVYGCTKVRDSNGWTHFIFREVMERPLPYEDGKTYVDADGDRLVFRKGGYHGDDGWESLETLSTHSYKYAARPLKEVLSEPVYGPEITE